MIQPLPPTTLTWLRQAAHAGQVEPQALLHLLDRVEALEAADLGRQHGAAQPPAAQPPAAQPAPPAAPAGALVERVALAIVTAEGDGNTQCWTPEARAAIRELALWFDHQGQRGCALLLREESAR
jgi:hypothetical protein